MDPAGPMASEKAVGGGSFLGMELGFRVSDAWRRFKAWEVLFRETGGSCWTRFSVRCQV